VVIRHNNVIIDRQARTIQIGSKIRRFVHRNSHSHGTAGAYFFKTVCYLVLNGRTRRDQLFDFIFADDEGGGPISGVNVLDVQLHNWKPKLFEVGLCIVKEKHAGFVWYKIQEIPVDA